MKKISKTIALLLSLSIFIINSGCTNKTAKETVPEDNYTLKDTEDSVPASSNYSSLEDRSENITWPKKKTKPLEENKNDTDGRSDEKKNDKTAEEEKSGSDEKNDVNKNNEANNENNSKEPENNKAPEDSSSKIDASSLDNTKTAWWFKPNSTHTPPEINTALKYNLSDYDAHYVGDTSRKVLYLTFDEGYENGYTGKILDILKDNDVKAIFFVTSPYIKSNPDLIKRMVDEGHIVGNHTNHHPSMPDVTGDSAKFENEFTDVADKFKEITGQDIPLYFRPPMGEYSQKSLAMTKNLGYKTVFWSFAYHDWDINNQPDPAKAKEKILGGLHNGSIMLIHAVSKTNTEILDSVLKEAKAQGYVFELLP